MSLRAPTGSHHRLFQTGVEVLDLELAGEMASSLGRAGEKVAQALAALDAYIVRDERRAELVKMAAAAVYAYFIQRELVGLRRHQDAIRDYGIPGEVLARLGAS